MVQKINKKHTHNYSLLWTRTNNIISIILNNIYNIYIIYAIYMGNQHMEISIDRMKISIWLLWNARSTPQRNFSNNSKRWYWFSRDIHSEKKISKNEKNTQSFLFLPTATAKKPTLTSFHCGPPQFTFWQGEPLHYSQNIHLDTSKYTQIQNYKTPKIYSKY